MALVDCTPARGRLMPEVWPIVGARLLELFIKHLLDRERKYYRCILCCYSKGSEGIIHTGSRFPDTFSDAELSKEVPDLLLASD